MDYLPMLLNKADQPFSDPSYIWEPKFDGIRLIVSRFNGKVRLWTRHGLDITSRYKELWDIPADGDVVLDAELIVVNEAGEDDFELCMTRFSSTRKERMVQLPAVAIVFDVLYHQSKGDVRRLPLTERKKLLDEILTNNPFYTKIPFVDEDGEKLFSAIQERRMEGVVAKKKSSFYDLAGRRTDAFLKIIDWKETEVWVTGWKKDEFGWLVSVNVDGGLRSAGVVELGVPAEHKKAFYGVARQFVMKEDKKYVYLDPHIQIRVKFRNWTKRGMLRTPVFINFVLAAT
jgi:DNA ligase-1